MATCTSAIVSGITTSSGRWSAARFHAWRASSQCGSPGATTWPVRASRSGAGSWTGAVVSMRGSFGEGLRRCSRPAAVLASGKTLMWDPDGVRVACCQIHPRFGEPDANRATAARAVEAAVERGARIVVLPELAASGYVFRDAGEARALAEPDDGPTIQGWAELCRRHGIVVVGGLCELDVDGPLRNSAALVDPQGVRAIYRKAHLWDR